MAVINWSRLDIAQCFYGVSISSFCRNIKVYSETNNVEHNYSISGKVERSNDFIYNALRSLIWTVKRIKSQMANICIISHHNHSCKTSIRRRVIVKVIHDMQTTLSGAVPLWLIICFFILFLKLFSVPLIQLHCARMPCIFRLQD